MRTRKNRISRLVSGLLLLAFASAGHARVITTGSSSYGESVNLTLTPFLLPNVGISSDPFPVSSGVAPAPYNNPNSAASVSVVSGTVLNLGTGIINTTANSDVDGTVGAKSTGATATVDDLGLSVFANLLGLSADVVQSSASINGNFGSLSAAGSADLTNAVLSTLGLVNVGLAANPAPNTHVDVLGLLGLTGVSLILNEQTVTGNGVNSQSMAVNAIHLGFDNFLSGTNTLNGDIIISHSEAQATAFRDANPVIQNAPVNFGNVRINTAATQNLSILNDVPNDGLSEKLNASAGATTGAATDGGAFSQLAPGAVNNTGIQVGLDTTVAGARSGTATINFQTDGTNVAGNGAGPAALPSQDVQVSGDVYRLANPELNTPAINLAARTGDPAPSAAISLTNSSPDQYTEGLKATPGAAPAGFTTSGSIANLAAQGTDAASLGVSLNTGSAGTFGGNLALDLASTGAGTTGAADATLQSQDVALNGKVYTPAVAQVNTPAINFGTVHVGDVVAAQSISVTNAATVTALNDVLLGSASASGAFTASGNLGAGLAAGDTAPNSLSVSLNTGTAGTFSGNANLSFQSHDPDLADLNLGGASVTLDGQVNNYADGSLLMTGGNGQFTQPSAHEYVLDLGNMLLGSGARTASLAVLNDVLGPADLLNGIFDLTGAGHLTLSGFSNFADLMAGQLFSGMGINFDPLTLGALNDTILLSIYGHNDSGYNQLEETITFRILGDVVNAQVPEPGTLILEILGFVLLLRFRRAMPQRYGV